MQATKFKTDNVESGVGIYRFDVANYVIKDTLQLDQLDVLPGLESSATSHQFPFEFSTRLQIPDITRIMKMKNIE